MLLPIEMVKAPFRHTLAIVGNPEDGEEGLSRCSYMEAEFLRSRLSRTLRYERLSETNFAVATVWNYSKTLNVAARASFKLSPSRRLSNGRKNCTDSRKGREQSRTGRLPLSGRE